MKIDPYKHKERYLAWKERVKNGILETSKENSDIILQFLNDMEKGINISSKNVKGSRSFIRLNTLRDKLCFFAKKFKEIYGINYIINIKEEQAVSFFADMKNGGIRKADNQEYRSVDTYAKVFKAFWHWFIKINKKERGLNPLNSILAKFDNLVFQSRICCGLSSFDSTEVVSQLILV